MNVNGVRVTTIDLGGFNELRFGRGGPWLYNKNDAYVGASLKVYGEYGHAEARFLDQLVQPEDTVVEVGANIGALTVGLARKAHHVYAYEPQRLCFQLLCANLALNQISNVRADMIGVGAVAGVLRLPHIDPTVARNFGGISLADEGEEPVHIETLDGLSLPDRINLLKIDVEGMELDVIRGGILTIGSSRPTIYCENDRREKSAALIEALQALGYSCYWHTPALFNAGNYAQERTNVFGKIVSANMLCRPNAEDENFGLRPVLAPEDWWKTE